MICPPSKPISILADPFSATGYHLREDAVDGVGMYESDLKPEQPRSRLLVDQLRAGGGELSERGADVRHLVGDVVHPGPATSEKSTDWSVLARRSEQFDATAADENRGSFDTLGFEVVSKLETRSEHPFVDRDRLLEVDNRDADMVNPARLHRSRC
jgi:hypothetical protein